MLNKTKYPTKEEILKEITEQNHKELVPTEKDIKVLKKWFKTNWKENKEKSLKELIQQLAKNHNTKIQVKVDLHSKTFYYNPQIKTIFLNNSFSVISSLHELGHHLFGTSELFACVWSVALFKRAMPKTYDRLEWKEHMLIKKH